MKIIEEIRTGIFKKNITENLMLCIYLATLPFKNFISFLKSEIDCNIFTIKKIV